MTRRSHGWAVGAVLVAAMSTAACTEIQEEPEVSNVLESSEPICGVLDPAALRAVLPEGSYSEAGIGIRRPDSGGGPMTGSCAVDDAQGRAAVSVAVETADSSLADGIRANDGWQTYTFPAEEGSGWAGHLGADTTAGYAVLERDGVIVVVTVHTPTDGRDGAEDAIELIRGVLTALEQR